MDHLVNLVLLNINLGNSVVTPIIKKIITEIILYIKEQNCANLNDPSFLQRVLLKRTIKRHMDVGFYKAYGDKIYDGLLKTAYNLTEDELDGFYGTANNS